MWHEGEVRSVFLSETMCWLLWWFICHSKGTQRCSLSVTGSGYTWTQGEDPEAWMVYLRAHSFILSCVLGTLVQEKIWIWYLSCKLPFFIKLTVSYLCWSKGRDEMWVRIKLWDLLLNKWGKTGGGLLDKPGLKAAHSKAKHTFMIITLTLIRGVSMRLSCRIAVQQCGC